MRHLVVGFSSETPGAEGVTNLEDIEGYVFVKT